MIQMNLFGPVVDKHKQEAADSDTLKKAVEFLIPIAAAYAKDKTDKDGLKILRDRALEKQKLVRPSKRAVAKVKQETKTKKEIKVKVEALGTEDGKKVVKDEPRVAAKAASRQPMKAMKAAAAGGSRPPMKAMKAMKRKRVASSSDNDDDDDDSDKFGEGTTDSSSDARDSDAEATEPEEARSDAEGDAKGDAKGKEKAKGKAKPKEKAKAKAKRNGSKTVSEVAKIRDAVAAFCAPPASALCALDTFSGLASE
jgi:hypothetical protein